MGAHVLDFELQLVLRPLVGALHTVSRAYFSIKSIAYLEGKVLEEVSSSVRPVSLCPATRIEPHADSRGLSPWRVLGSDLTRY